MAAFFGFNPEAFLDAHHGPMPGFDIEETETTNHHCFSTNAIRNGCIGMSPGTDMS